LKRPGDLLKEKDGLYTLRITAELWETIYFDEIKLMAIDHPGEYDIYVDEQFTPPPFPALTIFPVINKSLPLSAIDEEGRDVLPLLAERDDRYVSHFLKERYQGLVKRKELILEPAKDLPAGDMLLFLHGWIFPTDASINTALGQQDEIKVMPPQLQVINKHNQWETVGKIGFPMGKDKTVITDLSGKFLTADHRVRIVTNMEIYWDQAFFSRKAVTVPMKETTLPLQSADLHYRGYSAMYRKGGKYGPHWFDYERVTTGQKWRDLSGMYTRYGDVKPLLEKADSKYIIKNAGDETTLHFEAASLPALPEGWTRDFVIYSVGWVKDGDLNTADGNTVTPLPFHGIKSYPYSKDEEYPTTDEYIEYRKTYNTREVTPQEFIHTLSEEKKSFP
ncbi:MAG: hypothetical protein OEY51_06770, partial [Cyclobacteriaceae bacterium]|nr:hypothetical protein [Cyclobacteriaceae bacterium]